MTNKSYFSVALAGSLLLHVVIIGALLFNAQLSKPEKKQPTASHKPIVQASLVNQSDVNKQLDKLKKAKAQRLADDKARAKKLKNEQAKIKELERQRKKQQLDKLASEKLAKAAKKKQQQADAKAAKANAKAATAVANRKKQEKAAADAKKKRIAADKAAAKAKAKRVADAKAAKAAKVAKAKKAAAVKAAKAKAEKKRLDKIRIEKLRKEKLAKERAENELLMAQEMASEQAELTQVRRRAVLSEVDKYTALISGAIKRHWNVDESMKGKQCVLNIKLASSGLVYNVTPISGDKIVCKSAQNAVYKAHTLPVSKDPEVFAQLKEINLTVQPEFE